jgi:hypothetical protein
MPYLSSTVVRIVVLFGSLTPVLMASGPAWGADPVLVVLRSGRSYTAHVSERTDENRLWLRFAAASTVVLRPIDWNRVTRVEAEGMVFADDSFRNAAGDYVYRSDEHAKGADSGRSPWEPSGATDALTTQSIPTGMAGSSYAQWARHSLGPASVARSLRIHAEVANWDGDVEVDGIRLEVTPVDANGYTVPLDGSLRVSLHAPRHEKGKAPPPVRTLGRWSRSLKADEVGPSGATFHLEFHGRHPEFDTAIGSLGLVHVRLSSAGHGVLDASEDIVRIRPYGVVRDQLEQSGQGRFLPSERTGRNR